MMKRLTTLPNTVMTLLIGPHSGDELQDVKFFLFKFLLNPTPVAHLFLCACIRRIFAVAERRRAGSWT